MYDAEVACQQPLSTAQTDLLNFRALFIDRAVSLQDLVRSFAPIWATVEEDPDC